MKKIDQYIQGWLRHRTVLLDLLDLIHNEHTHYKPWNDAFSLGALAVHIADSMDMFVQAVKNGKFTLPTASNQFNQFESMDDVRKIVAEYTEKTKIDLQALTDSHLEQVFEFNQFVASGQIWLDTAKDHEIHHKGQLFTYARLIGIEKLPFFIVQPPRR
ncbi:DinB family protein [Aneurinibacillus aneurinilyticus]|uniref:DinB family protein n=1 Tax=Aneurinibacillus aneurinilyticus ATCC 12856 TaxID=649747 RepID=U1X4E8_ANEAE|nr:DinB family protein [Aneurinibacillus aneurinilyticus]ERI09413.1 DinB family protein [Aneurinibacillus aneurinilyticus ATCC 12856]MED0707588.1 DinB family protein [Aneurinibacillus aneurinilyticus]MED0722812.1 DinB family protein [Aneurinibacillus aneurinilyticus]MED0731261.1 DinB family protein [Aneurinibacillus aneurinilyticus]MED0743776.1 DinB family protein [Aneurinibacillus aneurinilyticus]